MGKTVTTAMLTGVLVAMPLIGIAATPQAKPAAKRAAAASHATKGTITSIDATHLVITRSGAKPTEMTFVLDPATQREGSPAVGLPVEVRYRTEGNAMIATAITTPESKQPASAHKAPSPK